MLAIYKKELRSYFTSLVGYVFIAFFLFVIGIYFNVYNIYSGYPNFEYSLSAASFILLILVPIITMRVMAEENRQKTDQLLITAPVKTSSIVLGKYLALMTVFAIVAVVICTYPLFLCKYGTVNLKTAYATILAFYFMGGTFMAVGLFISNLTDNQLVAAVVTFIVSLVMYFMSGIANLLPKDNKSAWIIFSVILLICCFICYMMMQNIVVSISIAAIGEAILTVLLFVKPSVYDGLVANVFGWFSVQSRLENFMNGMFDFSSIIYYISFIFIFLFLAVQSLNKRRWN